MLVPEKRFRWPGSKSLSSIHSHALLFQFTKPYPCSKCFKILYRKFRVISRGGTPFFPKSFPRTFGHIAGNRPKRLFRRAGIGQEKTGRLWGSGPAHGAWDADCQREERETVFTGLIRTIILYILIIAGIRLMGKRQVGGAGALGAGALPHHRGPGGGAHAGFRHPAAHRSDPNPGPAGHDHDPVGADHEEHPLPGAAVRAAQRGHPEGGRSTRGRCGATG